MSTNHIHFKLDTVNKQIVPGKLADSRGTSPQGDSYGFTNFYMTRNEKPFIPVVGEFHFSRFSYLYWEEELLKMKAGGVQIVATYIFWIYHEEEEGRFDWGGDRNLRHFIDLCGKHELSLILRIGPFCHGEVRNGGIPDWVFSKPLEIRSNDERYLFYAKRLYREIAKQMKGSLFQEGGPVIAVQLENEFMHAGAPYDAWGYKSGTFISSGKGGKEHLAELRRLAEEAGITPLLFTATAWGGAAVPDTDTLPMLAGYAYTPWIPNQPPSGEYIYRDLHAAPSEAVGYHSLDYPVAYCEMAGGMQVSYHARPFVSAESVEAMTWVKLASGSNLLGYYMYHGGSNKQGKHGFLNESALPKITYDYQAPLGEFGRIGHSYDRIRSVSLFLQAFGDVIADMGTVLPAGQADIAPDNTKELRWCIRQKDGAGFLFLNNFQDHVYMPDQEEIRIELQTSRGTIAFPHQGTLTLKKNSSAVLPFQLNMEGVDIVTATVQPLTKLAASKARSKERGALLVFYAHEGMNPELVLSAASVAHVDAGEGDAKREDDVWIVSPAIGKQHVVTLQLVDQRTVSLLILTREEALQTYQFHIWGEDRLAISGSHLYVHNERLVSTSEDQSSWSVAVYPSLQEGLKSNVGLAAERQEGLFTAYELAVETYEPELSVRKVTERNSMIRIDTEWPEQVGDVFLEIEYVGDVAGVYLGEHLLTDHIHYGKSWPIGLKQFKDELEDRELHIAITPLRKGTVHTFVNQALVERFEGVELSELHSVRAVSHYVAALSRA